MSPLRRRSEARGPRQVGRLADGPSPAPGRRDAGDAHGWHGSEEVALVVAIGRYDEEALAEAYRRHGGSVYALALRVLGDRAAAEEITQDIFLRLWERPESFDPSRGTLRAYLLVQTHGRAVDRLRQDGARRERQIRQARLTVEVGYDLEDEISDLALAERVRSALATLSPGERRAIELAYFGGHTYREVARLLEEPEGTVKSRIRSGLMRLHDSLLHWNEEER